MNERELRVIDGRLSLRTPQREALEVLANVAGSLTLAKDANLAAALEAVRGISPTVEDFERSFPSLCFALATGVGKTRLMGAFIAYLYRVHGLKHYLVLAPNLTIYEKLKADFTYGNPKFVFPGLGDIRDNLVVITGDDWEDGRGVRERDLRGDTALHVNIFNVAKINSEVRGGAAPRMKRLHEVIGDSYFDYLSKLDDLVLLMDESHRYRAQAGAKAIEGLRPVLGLELTATPQVVQGTRVTRFKNIAYEYPLANAIRDGFVKVPAVATRANFKARDYDADALERLKLEDGMTLHERTKVELDAYAEHSGQKRVKPFVLVVAEDTTHASALRALMDSDAFCDGRYKGRVIEVHSNQTGEIKDESLQRLLRVEDPAEPTEVVIHVNKLGEGWDVTNLYTIIPLRAASSVNLVEQALGRGLRLPYGRRTGNDAVDTLTVVAHEHFDAIVQRAREPGSLVKAYREVLLDRATATPVEKVRARPLLDEVAATPLQQSVVAALSEPGSDVTWEQLRSPTQREVAKKAVHERLARSPEVLPLALDDREFDTSFETAVTAILGHSIGIPRVTLRPRGEARLEFQPFKVNLGDFRPRPLAQEILVKQLQAERTRLVATGLPEDLLQPEHQLVRLLASVCFLRAARGAAVRSRWTGCRRADRVP
jgi:type III restriction enzyme